MVWCFSTRASVATVLTTHPCISRCLRVNDNGAKRFALMFMTYNVPFFNTVPQTGKSNLLALRPQYSRQTGSRPWLLMPWPLLLLVHQQLWYWLCLTFLCCTGKDFNYLNHFSIKEWYKIFPEINSARQGSMLFQVNSFLLLLMDPVPPLPPVTPPWVRGSRWRTCLSLRSPARSHCPTL